MAEQGTMQQTSHKRRLTHTEAAQQMISVEKYAEYTKMSNGTTQEQSLKPFQNLYNVCDKRPMNMQILCCTTALNSKAVSHTQLKPCIAVVEECNKLC